MTRGETLGDAVRLLREKRGLSLRGLGKLTGLSAPFLSDLEHNRRGTEKLGVIAKALGADLAHFAGLSLARKLEGWIEANPELAEMLRRRKRNGRCDCPCCLVLT